ncbi:hypothetical protein DIURU_004146 [Diutina rugosa]|uniref:Deacetylase sirtuin-type domain-containing protein n=1 Tax=Diutina rugosa TaxID=5481 RepID=A0A642UJ16_DIURU|nr:uncharacterized protein DIURU_004146 [Diutina rugosa]KAA8899889.1 hypothetical protein DIURU_004146 [Diutina rugosa]
MDKEIVLVDSDPEDDEVSVKRQRVDTPEDPLRFGTPFAETLTVEAPAVAAPVPPAPPAPPSKFSLQSDESDADDDSGSDLGEFYEDSALAKVSRRAPLGVPRRESVSVSGSESDADSSSSVILPELEDGDVPAITPEVIASTRKFLKSQGVHEFLQTYLPTAASGDDIARVILKLGFVPPMAPEPDNSNIMGLISFLNRVMTKVMKVRDRLEEVKTIDDALDAIQKAKKVLVITGAGISTSLGIPDFRSSKGFYSQIQSLGLNDPQEVFDLQNFHMDPSLFYSIAHLILPPENVYSPLHAFIKLLQDKGKLLRNYTQNIDNLESYAGIKQENLVQCHGSFATATCVTCRKQIPGEQIFPQIRAQEIAYCPDCSKTKDKILRKDDDAYLPESFGVFKPDITFFGESLPKRFHDTIAQDLRECDLLISVGTSLKVAPVADIVDKVPPYVPQIVINKDPIDHCNFDVSLMGYCDDVASYICNLMGPEWDIPHPDYDKIRGPDGSNLVFEGQDLEYREYYIINKAKEEAEAAEALKKEQEAEAEAAADGELNSAPKPLLINEVTPATTVSSTAETTKELLTESQLNSSLAPVSEPSVQPNDY